nr:putative transmembrane protein (PGPGW) [uncultured bacterium]
MVVIVFGIILLVLPGPGLLVIFLGLFILSLEFSWADRLYKRFRDRIEEQLDKLRKRFSR